jgi:hypothetical protein
LASKISITSRRQLIARVRHELESRGFPRLQMMLLVVLTGGAGFLASFSMLTFGVDTLAVRYPLAVGIAYLVFLLLLWLWLRVGADSYDGFDDVVVEILDAIPDATKGAANAYRGGGGQFGGGGSSAQWESKSVAEPLVELPEVSVGDVGEVASADEVAIPLAVILVVLGILLTMLFASVSIIYSAPVLFAEMLVDGVLAATLYRKLRRIDSRHWLQSAIRRTIVPFAITAMLVAAAGWGLSVYAPEARTLGEVFVRSAP